MWKACPFCETSFASLSSKPPVHAPQTPHQSSIAHVDRDADDDSYLDTAGSLSEILRGRRLAGLSVEIVKDRALVETIGNVAGQGGGNQDSFIRPAPYQNVDSEKFMSEFRKEAGTRGRTPGSPTE
jgi:hypothetical protein